jgi:uncharacterized HAD superfamily protein
VSSIINIGIDIDGVQAAFGTKYSQILRELYGESCPIISTEGMEVPAWDWAEWYPLTKEQLAEGWKKLQETKNFWTNLEMTNIEQVQYLIKVLDNHPSINIYFLTNRAQTVGDTVVKQSIESLKSFGWSNPQVIATTQKGAVARALDLRFFIDDMAENCAQVSLYYQAAKVFVLDKPYNRILQDNHFRIERISNLKTFADAVLKYVHNGTQNKAEINNSAPVN